MITNVVKVHIKEEFIKPFIEATEKKYMKSIAERGCIRFDVLQMEDDSTRFVIYKIYEYRDDCEKHMTFDHYFEWKEKTKPMLVEPLEEMIFNVIFPRKKKGGIFRPI